MAGTEGSAIFLDATVSDANGDAVTTAWAWAAGAGVDAGASCSFADASSVDTTITCTDDGTYTLTLTATDSKAPAVADTAQVTVSNAPPALGTLSGPPTPVQLNTPVQVSGAFTDPGSNDTHTCSADWGDGSSSAGIVSAGTCSASHAYATGGVFPVEMTVSDDDGGAGVKAFESVVVNRPPSMSAGSDVSGNEAAAISLDATVSDADGDAVTATWTWAAGAGVDPGANCRFADAGAVDTTVTCSDDGTYTLTLSATDGKGAPVVDTAIVTVANVAPTVGTLSGPSGPVAVNTAVQISGPFTDAGTNDTQTCSLDWRDGSSSAGTVSAGNCSASHTYGTAGVYEVAMTVTDDDGGPDANGFQYVVVYDSAGGFVVGGGWIDSPAGAYVPDPTVAGKASFGFISRYAKGATAPEGNTQFQFKAGDLDVRSTSYEWLVVSGSMAQYKGIGTMNGQGSYGFLLTAADGQAKGGSGVDTFRIKIWDRATGTVVYDNQRGDGDTAAARHAIEGGNIQIQGGTGQS